jgi:hypothetical protein
MILLRRFSLSLLCAVLCSCGEEKDPNRKATFPVTGKLTVDGAAPSSPVKIECHDVKGMDKENPTFSRAMTAGEGAFFLSTYVTADGVPEGDYVLTFEWVEWNAFSNNYGGPDKLNGRYKDPKTSKVALKVDGSGPVDLGTIELKTK